MSLEDDVRRLSRARPFDALPREALQLLAFSCQKRRIGAGEALFHAGEPASGAFFVLEGEIGLRSGETERRAAAGVLIGESALLAETARARRARFAAARHSPRNFSPRALRIPGERGEDPARAGDARGRADRRARPVAPARLRR